MWWVFTMSDSNSNRSVSLRTNYLPTEIHRAHQTIWKHLQTCQQNDIVEAEYYFGKKNIGWRIVIIRPSELIQWLIAWMNADVQAQTSWAQLANCDLESNRLYWWLLSENRQSGTTIKSCCTARQPLFAAVCVRIHHRQSKLIERGWTRMCQRRSINVACHSCMTKCLETYVISRCNYARQYAW